MNKETMDLILAAEKLLKAIEFSPIREALIMSEILILKRAIKKARGEL
jgi:hypothetical protein